ncbi:GIY-YIG nuclease family protein [Streptomyces sp. NBC_00847]|uniref:GIY-YIG nuclease family protein n=1 Tax=Streptomyces sp. NBC_00847 TaxID=2975850 RepID=UPI00225DF6A3|nr:GIY-YIG nuclease family protein [Streptomyces sp. NBC_00847]MCX4885899.1 GIY-YIG nuclease family protein [Streptomyces sp. NBC_00847]
MSGWIDQGPTALYRLYDIHGVLLYVGITNNPKRRWYTHSTRKAWWLEVAHKTVQWADSRDEADRLEREAIKSEMPLYNWSHADRAPLNPGEIPDARRLPPAKPGDWVSYWSPPETDPLGYENADGTLHVNPAWAEMSRRLAT